MDKQLSKAQQELIRNRMLLFCHSIREEYLRSRKKFEPFSSGHEGYAVLLEEVEELWVAIKDRAGAGSELLPLKDIAVEEELIQVAAMALALYVEVTGREICFV